MFVQVKVIRLNDVSNAKHHIRTEATKKEMEDGHQLCTFNFTAKWDDSGYYIPLLINYHKTQNNGCPWHSCIAENEDPGIDMILIC